MESRLAVVLAPLLAACVVALALKAWWPVELAGLMLGVGLAFDLTLYHRLFPISPAGLRFRSVSSSSRWSWVSGAC